MTVRLSLQPALDLLATSYFKKIIVPAQALTFLSALITFCVMCVYSQSAETAQSALETALNRFMLYVVENGGAAMIVHLFYLVVVSPHSNLTVGRVVDSVTPLQFLIAPGKRYWIPFQLISRRLFAVSLLTVLNGRINVRGKGVYREDADTIALSNRSYQTNLSTLVPASNPHKSGQEGSYQSNVRNQYS